MNSPNELAEALQQLFALETSLFQAYAVALRSADTRLARETLLDCQAASARARGRLMAELERQEVSYSEEQEREQSAEVVALVEASGDAETQLDRIGDLASERGDERLARLADDLARDHESRRKSLGSLVREKGDAGA